MTASDPGDPREYARDADRVRHAAHETPMSLGEYVEAAFADPGIAAHASRYLLDAIEAAGTRTVVEEGEERERYRFFDDPHNDGEHAVLGNTATLNEVVDDLRAIAAGQGKAEKILWFAGPTATGKSELKRCLVNGLREYSKTEAGRRYTVEWNVAGSREGAAGLTYGGSEAAEEWERSPVQAAPLSVFPPETRERVLDDLNGVHDGVPVRADADLDPFSREAYEEIESEYRERDREDPFSAATARTHLRVTNYVMDVGRGIGVLHAEDTGTPKERLVGSWMPQLLDEFAARGRKHPGAFSFDGVLSQGNGGVTVVEDAAQHADLLRKLLNVPDERAVKLDKGITMDLDTQLVVISNLDLEAQLNQHADQGGRDPLKALKRRLSKHRFGYLTNLGLEVQLLRRELSDETAVWETADPEARAERIRAPLHVSVHTAAGRTDRELAPHTLEAAALYDVVTRLDEADLPPSLSLVEKALLYDRGYIEDGDERRETDEFDLGSDDDGSSGVPVTYTRDVVADLLHEPPDRHHPELDVGAVLTPSDVLDALVDGLAGAPVFSATERAEFEERVLGVKDYVFEQEKADVLAAAMRDRGAPPEVVEEYVEHVYASATDAEVTNGRGEPIEPDPLKMKVFETEHLGFDEGDYAGNEPRESVREFRERRVITALNRHAWEHRTEDFRVEDVDLRDVPVIRSVLEARDVDDLERAYPDLDPGQWADPPDDTETAAVKETTLGNLVEHRGYSRASAELASRRVMREVSARWV